MPASAIIYTRVSTEEQGREGLSLGAQLADCRRYALAHNWVIAGEYTDEMSGKRDDRPRYQELLRHVRRLRREGQEVVVVVKWLHRFGRRVSERVRAWEELDKLAAPIHSVADGGVVTKLVHDILAAVAEEESRQIGERISATWRHVTEQGWAKIGRVPWGYQLRAATQAERALGSPKTVLEVDERVAPYVAEAFQRLANGESARSVARWVSRLPREVRGGRALPWPTMRRFFARTIYVGRPVNGEVDVLERKLGKWPAIVSDDVWERAQQHMDGHQRMPHQATGRYILTGLIYCPKCSSRMRGDAAPGRRPRYRCSGYDAGSTCRETADAGRVEQYVIDQVGAMVDAVRGDPKAMAALRRARQVLRQAEGGGDPTQQIRRLEAEIERARGRILRSTEMFVDGELDKATYDGLCASERAKIAHAEDELVTLGRAQRAKAATREPTEAEILALFDNFSAAMRSADSEAQRVAISAFVDRVVPHRVKYGVYEADVVLTELGEKVRAAAEA